MAIMTNGHATTIAFADDSAVLFEVKELTPFGMEVAEIDTTTMSNATYKSKVAGALQMGTDATLVVAYDPATLDEIKTMLGANQLITITFPSANTWAFWGFIKSFTPGASAVDAQPTATIVLTPSFENDSGAETAPVYA